MTSGEPPSEAPATTSVDDLVKRVQAMTPGDELGRTWWPWLTRAIEVGWLDQDDLLDVIAALGAGSDVGNEELAFEHIDGTVRVSFQGEEVHVSSSSVIDALASVLHLLREPDSSDVAPR